MMLCFGELLYASLCVFLLCYFITMITTETAAIGDIAYDSTWYHLPCSEQAIVQMIIRRAQRPCELKGLDVIVCSLETFGKVRAPDCTNITKS